MILKLNKFLSFISTRATVVEYTTVYTQWPLVTYKPNINHHSPDSLAGFSQRKTQWPSQTHDKNRPKINILQPNRKTTYLDLSNTL